MIECGRTVSRLFVNGNAHFAVSSHDVFRNHTQESALLGFSSATRTLMLNKNTELMAWVVSAGEYDVLSDDDRQKFLDIQKLRSRLISLQTFPALRDEWDWLRNVGVVFVRERITETSGDSFTAEDVFFSPETLSEETINKLRCSHNTSSLLLAINRTGAGKFEYNAVQRALCGPGETAFDGGARANEAFECLYQGGLAMLGKGALDGERQLSVLNGLGFAAYRVPDFINAY